MIRNNTPVALNRSRVYRLRANASANVSDDNKIPDTVTVGSYNVENMFDGIDEDPQRGNREKPERELQALAKVIKRSGADVVALQEVENKEVLQSFVDRYLPEYGDVVLVEGNDARGIDVAVISKYPIKRVLSHKNDVFPTSDGRETKFKRDALRVDVDVPGYPLSVYTVHLKSRRGGEEAAIQRHAEAQELRRIIDREMKPFPKHNFVVTGDFNDTPGSETLASLTSPEKTAGKPLFDTLEGKPWSERDTWPSSHPRRQFDHILIPQHMKDDLVQSKVNRYPESEIASDHLMITAKFKIRPDKPALIAQA